MHALQHIHTAVFVMTSMCSSKQAWKDMLVNDEYFVTDLSQTTMFTNFT